MSIARPVFKKVSLMLTRRVRQRVFLLRPSKRTDDIVAYVLAVIARRYGIWLHAVKVLSNHWHVCLTDPEGKIVEFQRDCHQFIARALNDLYGDVESVWGPPAPDNRVECEGPADLIGRIAYTMANGVQTGLVRFGHNWPGIRRAWPMRPLVVRKPPRFFRGEGQGGTWPDEISLEMTRPPGYEELSDEALAAMIAKAIEDREEMFRKQYDAEGRRFLGRKAVRTQSRYDRPSTPEKPVTAAAAPGTRRPRRPRLARLRDREWLADYRVALGAYNAGNRDVVFPHGTYLMRVRHGVNCAAPPH